MATAQTKMKALVVSRLLMGDIQNWATFESERRKANQIFNRRAARSVSSQIGRGYRELSSEIEHFIGMNFLDCDYAKLAELCDKMTVGTALSLRLDEFERAFFPLALSVKRRIPAYAHIHISPHGLRFEFPEHHFLRDLETALTELLDVRMRIATFEGPKYDAARDGNLAGGLIAKENFLSRSIISAAFSLVEAFLSGLFFTAINSQAVGRMRCDEEFLKFSATKESSPLKDRIDRVVRFVSGGTATGKDEPFKAFVETSKRYRDAIHHSTPFQRKDIEPGGRLTALYEIDGALALRCVEHSAATLLKISGWINQMPNESDIAIRCNALLQIVHADPSIVRGAMKQRGV